MPSLPAANNFMNGPTIGARIDHSDRATNSFDFVRLCAAVAVLVSHAFVLTTGSENSEPLYALTGGRLAIGFVAVGIFFSVSGFLIDRSLERSRSLMTFAIKRCLRILPGLWVSIAVTMTFAALFLAADGLQLFGRASSWRFASNALLLPAPATLPGVFEQAPLRQVFNGSLWTLKHEAACYVLTVIVFAFGRLRRHVLLALWVGAVVISGATDPAQASGIGYLLLTMIELFQFFGLGMIVNQFKHAIPLSMGAALAMVAIWFAALWSPFSRELTPLLLTYPPIALGVSQSSLAHRMTAAGDLSYGIYVYAFPVQQLVIPLSLAAPVAWGANIMLALPLTYALAFLSWRYVEKPAMGLAKILTIKPERSWTNRNSVRAPFERNGPPH